MTRKEVSAMIRAVECRRGLPAGAVMGPHRDARVSSARQECYLRLHVAGLSYPEIGHVMRKDHSTVVCGVQRFKAIEPRYAEAIRLTVTTGPASWRTAIDLAASRRATELKAGILERQAWAFAPQGEGKVAA